MATGLVHAARGAYGRKNGTGLPPVIESQGIEPPVPPDPRQVEALLERLAARLIWWMPPAQALRYPDRVIAQVMDIGDFEDVMRLRGWLGDQRLAEVLQRAEAGWFSPRSWTYWHRKLDLAPADAIPPLPRRRFGE